MRLALSLALVLLFPAAALAVQEQPVDLRPNLDAQLKAERGLKSLLDEWASNAFDVGFVARSEVDLANPDQVKLRLDGLRVAFRSEWYGRYRKLWDEIYKLPFAPAAIDRARSYARQGDGRLRATLLDAKNQPLFVGPVDFTRAPSHDATVEAHLFNPTALRPLPLVPPKLAQIIEAPPGESPYVVVPTAVVRAARRVRVGDMLDRRWPVELRDPFTATPAPPPRVPPSPSASPSGAPVLPAPVLGTPSPL